MSAITARWRRSRLLQGSLAVHCGALALSVWRSHWWPWTLGAVLVNQALLAAIGLTPRSSALGPNWTHLPERCRALGQVAITIDDGPDPQVTPQVLTILAAHRARATFFCIGERAGRFPALVQECVQAGHAIENHSYVHPAYFALLGLTHLKREIQQAQQVITELSGMPPKFFRAPAGLRSPLLDPVLEQLGLQLASWTRRAFDTLQGDPDTILMRLTHRLRAGDILLLHDGHAARGANGEPVILAVLPRLLRILQSRGLTPITLREALP